jgi:hypothetical protein
MRTTFGNIRIGVLLVTCTAALLHGCGSQDAGPVQGKVLAHVNGSPITAENVDRSITATLGADALAQLGPEERRKVLESLVTNRAMAQGAEAELDDGARRDIEARVAAFREQLLVKRYLAAHGDPTPVSDDMVREYYDGHPERFGGGMLRQYEMVTTTELIDSDRRARLTAILGDAGQKKDWHGLADSLAAQGYPVQYRTGDVNADILHPRLRKLMQPLALGEAAKLTFIEGRAYLVRVTGERRQPPKPLAEVAAQIRKALVPAQLKKAIARASEEALKDTKVEYVEQ